MKKLLNPYNEEVKKSIVVNHKNKMFAVCCSGRDVTEWYISIEKAN